jgi:phosphatidylglycerophosphate synthase
MLINFIKTFLIDEYLLIIRSKDTLASSKNIHCIHDFLFHFRCLRRKDMVYLNYKDIRKDFQGKPSFFCDHYAMRVSPILTKFFLSRKTIPNVVTLLMILSGILGGILFSFDNVALKIIAIVFIHGWYILDCSDGEVARITKTFSKMGKELDYTAHIVNHPIFLASFMISISRLDGTVTLIQLMICLFLLTTLDLINRNLYSFFELHKLKVASLAEEKVSSSPQSVNIIKKLILIFINNTIILPNFIIFFPVIHVFDMLLGTNITLYYFIIKTAIMCVLVPYAVVKWIKSILFI